MSKAKRGDVVEVIWRDSEELQAGWETPKKYRAAARAHASYRTSGYLLELGDPVMVVQNLGLGTDRVNGVMTIPRSAVVTLQVLGRADPKVTKALK